MLGNERNSGFKFRQPEEIERESFRIIRKELSESEKATKGRSAAEEAVLIRAIHATADFDFAKNLRFTPGAAELGIAYLRRGRARIITDSNMAKVGISHIMLEKSGGTLNCFMAMPEIEKEAARIGFTRAYTAMDYAVRNYPDSCFAVGNAPTALFRLAKAIKEEGLRPPLVIGSPVGFVNVAESKEAVYEACSVAGVPAIVAMGRKGGSTVCAAIVNALLKEAL